MPPRAVAVAAALLATGALGCAASAQESQEVIQPNVVAYTPNAGYTGPAEFQYERSGPGRDGRTLPFGVRIQVRVVGPDAPVR